MRLSETQRLAVLRSAFLVAALVLLAAMAMALRERSVLVPDSPAWVDDAPPPMFLSRETGPVQLSSFGGNAPDPYGTPAPTRISIQLANRSKRALFGSLQLRHTTIASAAITEPRLCTRFEMGGVSVLGVSVNRSAPVDRPEITVQLAVDRFTVTATPRPYPRRNHESCAIAAARGSVMR